MPEVRYVITDDTDHHVIDTAESRAAVDQRSWWRNGATAYAYRILSPRNVEQLHVSTAGEMTRAVYSAYRGGIFAGYVHAETIAAALSIGRAYYGPGVRIEAA